MTACHAPTSTTMLTGGVALVGHPNVGKSVIFQRLTGRYVTVSNYPGTTIEVARGTSAALQGAAVIDTPGVVTLPPRSEDEQVTARVLLDEPLRAVVQVGDAKNLRRTLLLTVQLAELGAPLVLALNMIDEASARGVTVDQRGLAERLGLPVVPTIATRGAGIGDLAEAVGAARPAELRLAYPEAIEAALADVEARLPAGPVAPRALALFWLSGDPVTASWLAGRLDGGALAELRARRDALQMVFVEPLSAVIQRARLAYVAQLVGEIERSEAGARPTLRARLGQVTTHPLWGLPILALVLYAMYWFVGVLGAGALVGLLEQHLFGEMINPWLAAQIARLSPPPLLSDLLVGEYGLWTLGMTYALALILPIVTTFFLAFGVLEDSGYLPRLAVLSNRLFRLMGLNGRAVLPMVLGLGCVTMATLTTRIMESRRDRLLVILLLALAVPCSAQLGVVMGMLAAISFGATLIWLGVVLLVLLSVGWLAARLVPGERSMLLLELPPLRRPVFSNVLVKTMARVEWYAREVVPMFLVGTLALFALNRLGALPWLIRAGEPLVVGWLGLPREASAAMLLGFLRRDFGATGLFVMGAHGLLSPRQTVVAMVTITLFIPCVASVLMIVKERGARTAAAMTALIFPLALLVGGLLSRGLLLLGWGM
jgi:ferrous iron transport protein B